MRHIRQWMIIVILTLAGFTGLSRGRDFDPNICVPYDELARLIDPQDKAILMDRGEFEKLLLAARAKARQADSLELGYVRQADYQGEISGEELHLSGTLEAVCMNEGPVAVPLGFAQFGLIGVLLDGKSAPLGYDANGRLTLIVTGKGQHQLKLTGAKKLNELSSGGMQFSLSLPPAVTGKMKLYAAGDLDIRATAPQSQAVYDKDKDRTEVEFTLGGLDKLTVVLLGNGRQEDDKAIILAESATTVKLNRLYQEFDCLYTVQMLRRGVKELSFHVPAEWTVTEVTCPDLVKWSVSDLKQDETGKELKAIIVRLRSAKTGTLALHIKATTLREGRMWRSPQVILDGAEFQRGYLLVNTAENLHVRGEKLSGVRRENPLAIAAAGIIGGTTERLYFHWGANWSVDLDVARAELRRSVKEKQTLLVSSEQVSLIGQFEITAIDRELFDMTFVLPEQAQQWHLETVEVEGQAAGFEYRLFEMQDKSQLLIELAHPVQPEKMVTVKLVLRHVPANWDWPSDAPPRMITVPLVESRAQTVAGEVLIWAIGDLDALPKKIPDNIEAIPVGRMSSLGISEEIQYAYSYKASLNDEIQLEILRRRPRISADAIGLFNVSSREYTGNWHMIYHISRAHAGRIYLLADKSLGEKITITATGVPIRSKNIVDPGKESISLPETLQEKYHLWLLDLDYPAIGDVAVDVSYIQPREETKFTVPLIRPICQGQINEQLAIQAGEELALDIQAEGVKEIDAMDLPPLPREAGRVLGAYSLKAQTKESDTDVAITLQTTVHHHYEIPSSLAVSGAQMTYLDPKGGQRTEATFFIVNAGEQFLTFRLPPDAQLWSLSVAGEQAKPQRSAEGDYQVALGQYREPVPIKIVYTWQPQKVSLDRVELGGVELVGMEMNKTSWRVIPPPGYQITAQKTKMQTRDLTRPTPAYIQLFDFMTEHLLDSPFMPALGGSLKMAKVDKVTGGYEYAADEAAESIKAVEKTEDVAGRPISPPPPPAPPMPQAVQIPTQKALGVRLTQEGRYSLPVDLLPTPGAGPGVNFTGLGKHKLIVQLASQARMSSGWLVGFLLVITGGMALGRRKAKVKAILFFAVLSLATLLAIWWPGLTTFANGAFMAGISLLPLYLLTGFVCWVWGKLHLSEPVSRRLVTAVTLFMLVLILNNSAQAADVEKPQNEKMPLPGIIIPYDGDATQAGASGKVFISYQRFVELWNQAHPEDPMDVPHPKSDISLAEVKYAVTITDEQLELRLTAEVRTYRRDQVVLPLPIAGLAVASVTFKGQDIPLQMGAKGMVVMLPGEASGPLQMKAVVKPDYLGRRGSANFTLPPLPGAVMAITLPQDDLELEVEGIDSPLVRQTSAGQTVEYRFPLGMTQELKLRWMPKLDLSVADTTLSATVEHDVYAFHWSLVGVSTITYDFSAGQHDRFGLLAPTGATITDLDGANLRDYRELGEQTIDGRVFRLLEVRLHRPAAKTYKLTVRWLNPLPKLDQPEQLFVIRAANISRESGTITLHAAGGMMLKTLNVSGGRRVDLPAPADSQQARLSAQNALPVAKYYWPYRPFSLQVQLSRIEASPAVDLNQLVRVNTDGVQLLVGAQLKCDKGLLFGADFALPEGYELLSVVGPAVGDFYEQSNNNGGSLHVNFSSAVADTMLALVLTRNDVSLDHFSVPTIMYMDAEGQPLPQQQGRIAVQVAQSLEAQTATSKNLKSISPTTLRDWLDENQFNAVQFAYRYETANPALTLKIHPQPTELRVEIFTGLVVRATAAVYTYRLRYDISGSPLDQLRFCVPAEYASLAAVESPAMRSLTQTPADNGQTAFTVALVNESTGIVDVTVNFALPIETSTRVIPVPRIETSAPAGYRAIVAVQNAFQHDITVREKINLQDLAVSEQQKLISRQMSQSLQYVFQSFESDWSLSFDFTPAKIAKRIQAVVDLLALTTVIDRDGRCRYEARVALQNRSEQFLRIKVPQGLQLWSATVAEHPVKPVTEATAQKDEILIPLVKTSPGGLPYDVFLYFAGQDLASLNGISRLRPPGVTIVGIPIMQTTWSLRLPGGYRYLRPGGNMAPVAGTAEMLSISVETRLKQLDRLGKSYQDTTINGAEDIYARQNLRVFNVQVAAEIEQAQKYLESNRDEMSGEEYRRLKTKLDQQKSSQDVLQKGQEKYFQTQDEKAQVDINFFLNDSSSNTGVSEWARNEALLEKPAFVQKSEQEQIALLEQQLQTIQAQSGLTIAGNEPAMAPASTTDALIAAQDARNLEAGAILNKLADADTAQMAQRQLQLQKQLGELKDNRMQRQFMANSYDLHATTELPVLGDVPLQAPQAGSTAGYRHSGFGGVNRRGRGLAADAPQPPMPLQMAPGMMPGMMMEGTAPAGGAGVPQEGEAAGVQLHYAAAGMYSLPVTLPEGEVRLDFARPSGGAELSILAVPVKLIHNLYGTATVIVGLLLVLGVIKIWPKQGHKEPLSTRRMVGYIVLLVLLTILAGLLGFLVSVVIILLSEIKRGVSGKRLVSKTKH
ncbi:MAG: hypothetical protein JW709_02260 [Sedimentisphaerales bacterium]|nr:hypothetical protein [Sedimentisphaerales bacterium]